MPEELEGWEVARLAAMTPAEIVAGLKAYADAVEAFRRTMLVGSLYATWRDGSNSDRLDERLRGMDDEFLATLANFGAKLAERARAERSKAEVRRTGSSYSRGA